MYRPKINLKFIFFIRYLLLHIITIEMVRFLHSILVNIHLNILLSYFIKNMAVNAFLLLICKIFKILKCSISIMRLHKYKISSLSVDKYFILFDNFEFNVLHKFVSNIIWHNFI